ncbi:PAS domain S-box-containing protein [Natronoarchaeum philippinense]|uniref:PAS domain S-box-containing protein n=1 Tax=Natronoarchaeum philippinense TaxID=558529 RepID=A0A285P285_NATPI|nr:bacterio-opsin activator domain-containing protein [Natronoarchaeum philippinense]SNZ15845.1 PAS domain S-box-containing protein [Natronoarchaeum philippinense]
MVSPDGRTDHLLYVDPDDAAVEAVSTAFGDAVVETARTAESARELVLRKPIDCVICEHDLPDDGGLELLSSVREGFPTMPVILFVEDGDETLASAALSAGVTEYVIKPPLAAGVERLAETVTELLERRPDNRGTIDVPGSADEEVPMALKERAMDEAPVGITIADAQREDEPLIYVNEAFERLTGYDRATVLGKNCRFLQGPATASEPVDRLRDAIDAGVPASEELINYRKDGRMFWNRVDLAPIYGDELAYFVGFQTDITDRKRAQFAARQRAESLDNERQTLERLLDRIDGLVLDVTQTLVEASCREEMIGDICERIGDAEPYDFAWIGDYDVVNDQVHPAADTSQNAQFVDELDVEFGPETVIGTAIDDRELAVVQDSANSPGGRLHGGDWPDRFQSMAAVPLAYRDTVHGVLCVYAAERGVFAEHERAILTALGRAIATAINARESEERLTTDTVAELEFGVLGSDLFVVSLADDLDCHVEYVGSVRAADGQLVTFVDVTGADPQRLEATATALPQIAAANITTITDDGCLAEIKFGEPFVVEVLAEWGVETRSIVADPSRARLTASVSQTDDAREVADRITERFPGVDLLAYRERDRPAETQREFAARLEGRLTDRQQSALRRAYASDYFEWPRPISGDELAESMDITRSTFHQHLRAAERKLVAAFYEERDELSG